MDGFLVLTVKLVNMVIHIFGGDNFDELPFETASYLEIVPLYASINYKFTHIHYEITLQVLLRHAVIIDVAKCVRSRKTITVL